MTPESSGPKSARNTSGWPREKISENGSRSTVSVSRHHTLRTSVNDEPDGESWRLGLRLLLDGVERRGRR